MCEETECWREIFNRGLCIELSLEWESFHSSFELIIYLRRTALSLSSE